MSSSEDDMPLARSNGHLSASRISKSEDKAMDGPVSDKSQPSAAGISIRNGPVNGDPMDIDHPNGGAKRKARQSISKPVSYKDESDSDDVPPLAKRLKAAPKKEPDSDDEPIAKRKLPPSINETSLPVEDSSDDDQPLGVKLAKKKAQIEKQAEKDAKAIRASETKVKKPAAKRAVKKEESSDDEPIAKSKPVKRATNGTAAKKANGLKMEKTPAKGKAAPKKEAKSNSPDEDDEEEAHEWWNEQKPDDDSIKWTTLEHSGVLFPPEYEPLPKSVRLYYDGTPLELQPEAEEAATFFGSMLNSENNVKNPVFQKNFFSDFTALLKKTGGAKDKNGNKVEIKDFAKLDFEPMYEHFRKQSEEKKAWSKEKKQAEKEKRLKIEEPFMFCKWDGRKEKVGNFRVEPPGLFRGRGEHPKTGKIKKRVLPEQVTINIGKEAKVPQAPAGHKWKAVQHDNKATWLAMWQENVNGNYKYVMLSASAAVKGKADFKKFEKARELKKRIDFIRKDYEKKLKSEMMQERQMATAMYLIDKFALRAGNEKDTENEADTVGCCSLKFEHVTLREPDIVIFDFLGKDSIRYYDECQVDRQVFKNLKMFKKPPKEDGDDIFDRVNTSQLNKHLSNYMEGLTAKVFRTYNASYTMSNLLQQLNPDEHKNKTINEKVKLYNDCNREVAILCNHKRTVGAKHEEQMEKMTDRIKGAKYQKWRTKMMILDVDPKQKKKKGADFFTREEELTDEWIIQHQAFLIEEQRTKITKKFQKDNEKLVAEKKKPLPEKEHKERLKAVKELEAKFKKENKSKKVEAEGRGPSVEKLEGQIKKIDERIKNLEAQSADREGNKEVALGTSKINYIDPRLSVVFSNKMGVPIERLFPKTLREKFNWAIQSIGDDPDWEF
ncbi:eukaryotic DNA topoisomerase I [Coniella lustricola]|uniref:DNA topoisomerase I n=1 Tax=Coniella lustricola TaxID=2025994 RepID=A0A2T3ADJ7_9PEZI|nr:eukaryotic DNA topoisomerase I [Coniella lustricola]